MQIRAAATGGNGGTGYNGAKGGQGAAVTMTNVVAGATNDSFLLLMQTATGGAGGGSQGVQAGNGGAATSSFTFNDNDNSTLSASLSSTAYAYGGAGGDDLSPGAKVGAGGAATAFSDTIGSSTATVSGGASAEGGAGGANSNGQQIGAGGSATATAEASGGTADAYAGAESGASTRSSGGALADASVTGPNGRAQATAGTILSRNNLINSVSAYASAELAPSVDAPGSGPSPSAPASNTAEAQSQTSIGTSAPALVTGYQAVAMAACAPDSASVNSVLGANPTIASAFGSSATYFALGETGGGYSTNGAGAETSMAELQIKINLALVPSLQDLVVGFYDPSTSGAGFTSLTLSMGGSPSSPYSETFTSVSAAQSYFDNNAVDLGALKLGKVKNNIMDFDVELSITTDTPGSAFDFGLLIGNGSSAAAVSSHSLASASEDLLAAGVGVKT